MVQPAPAAQRVWVCKKHVMEKGKEKMMHNQEIIVRETTIFVIQTAARRHLTLLITISYYKQIGCLQMFQLFN